MSTKVAYLIQRKFCSDQTSYITQLSDGNYSRTYGLLDASRIASNIAQRRSFGSYQKNLDSTVRWVCFDFDVAKEYINTSSFSAVEDELNETVDQFCGKLKSLEIPYLLEFSGNRGMHVWILFSERIDYSYANKIANAIIEAADLQLPKSVLLDLFPASKRHSDGVGLGVKLPLSKHTKSGKYSLLLRNTETSKLVQKVDILTDEIINQHIEILSRHPLISKPEIELKLSGFIELDDESFFAPLRIKEVQISSNFTFGSLTNLWNNAAPLAKLITRITVDKALNIGERKLLVGLLSCVKSASKPDFSNKLLHHIFSKIENYDEDRTEENIRSLEKFSFPTQDQIESVSNEKFSTILGTGDLIAHCIPNMQSFIDSTLEILIGDIETVRKAEIKYILQNDEVHSKRLLTEINYTDGQEILASVLTLLKQPTAPQHYIHDRIEEKKTRKLITLGLTGRMTTSAILSQILNLIKFNPSPNSHGYQINRGFKDGHIFKPWLNLWVRFVNNISSALESRDNQSYYIVKTDIEQFYDNIPHENLKRLLMGGVNSKVDSNISMVTDENMSRYKALLDALFAINAQLVKSDRGLPQGPAYARFLAELYMDNIDANFDLELISGSVFLYQRYVDDIFFICETEEKARERLTALEKSLKTLGLKINHDKTIVARISDFNSDFKKFTAQSKYVVDRASRNFDSTTIIEKNLAINEFIRIIQSDSCEDDLAFIFSHLAGVSMLDSLKQEKVVPTLKKGTGRGSMLRHLFAFVLASEDRWNLLFEIEKFTVLQSEVLTSTLLAKASSTEGDLEPLLEFLQVICDKLSHSELVDEHLVYLSFMYGANIEQSDFPADVLLKCIASYPEPQSIRLSESTIRKLSLTLNAEQSMGYFVDIIYPLCISLYTPPTSLNELAQTFYSKVGNDYTFNRLAISEYPEMLFESHGIKFYHLLCLFSLSDQNDDHDLLKALWKFTTDIHNVLRPSTRSIIHSDEWFSKLGQIKINPRTNNLVVSSIVEGSMYRGGSTDNKKIFDRFHNLLIIFISGNLHSESIIQIETILRDLKSKALFYKWILERENVSTFPSHSWFEKNVCENNIVILKKGSEILVRRPTEDFVNGENIGGGHNGYSERIERYDESAYASLKDTLEGLSLVEKLSKLITMVEGCLSDQSYPNIYSLSRLVNKSDFSPFTGEIRGGQKILFEDGINTITSLSNSTKSFIQCFFRNDFSDSSSNLFRLLREKYISNLGQDIDIYKFIKYAKSELEQIADADSEMYLDFSVSTALYLSLNEKEYEKRLELFVNIYEKFNKTPEQQHIFFVNTGLVIDDTSPLGLITSTFDSLKIFTDEVMPSSSFNLHNEINDYLLDVEKSISNNIDGGHTLSLIDFKRTRIEFLQTEGKIDARGAGEFYFEKVFVVNIKLQVVEIFEFSRHQIVIARAQYVYYVVYDDQIYVLPILNAISKIFSSLQKRLAIIQKTGEYRSYPIYVAGSLDTSQISTFDPALRNVAVQRDITIPQAETVLRGWLSSIPKKYRSPLCSLIAGHIVMTPGEVSSFVHKVAELMADPKGSSFFIKRIGDINGTHRILMRDTDSIRQAENFGPCNIKLNATSATLIVDTLVSGSQISKALQFYATGQGSDQKYYIYTEVEKRKISEALKSIKEIVIVNVFHTGNGIKFIQDQCRTFLNSDVIVRSIHGRDVGEDAYFGSSRRINAAQKMEIRKIFDDIDSVNDLFNHLEIFNRSKESAKDFRGKRIDAIDLVARYQSLTKKCFNFLHSGTKHNRYCRPFVRAREPHEFLLAPTSEENSEDK